MNVLFAPLFTLSQASGGGGVFLPALIPFALLAWWRWPKDALIRRKLWWLLALPIPWIALSYWTATHWHEGNLPVDMPVASNVASVSAILITLVSCIAAVTILKGARTVAALAAVLNFYLAVIGALLCAMATTGSWM